MGKPLDELKKSIRSESTKRRNPHLFGPPSGLDRGERKQDPVPALDREKPKRQRGTRCVVEVCLLSLRTTEVDDDNLAECHKELRDSIAQSLGIDDGDSRIRFRYAQCITRSKPHTLIVITQL